MGQFFTGNAAAVEGKMAVLVDGGIGRMIGRLRVAGIVDVQQTAAEAARGLEFGSGIRVGPVAVGAMNCKTGGAKWSVAVIAEVQVREAETGVACVASRLGS